MTFIQMERRQLADRADGKLARALGRALPEESQEYIDRLGQQDQRRAQQGLVELRQSERVWYKRLDDLTREERPARLEAEKATNAWLKSRVERLRAVRSNYS